MNRTFKEIGIAVLLLVILIFIIGIGYGKIAKKNAETKFFSTELPNLRAKSNNSMRKEAVSGILKAVTQLIADNKGKLICNGSEVTLPSIPTNIGSDPGLVDIELCISPYYIAPSDSSITGDNSDKKSGWTVKNTGYTIMQDSLTKKITVSAPLAEPENGIPLNISETQ